MPELTRRMPRGIGDEEPMALKVSDRASWRVLCHGHTSLVPASTPRVGWGVLLGVLLSGALWGCHRGGCCEEPEISLPGSEHCCCFGS